MRLPSKGKNRGSTGYDLLTNTPYEKCVPFFEWFLPVFERVPLLPCGSGISRLHKGRMLQSTSDLAGNKREKKLYGPTGQPINPIHHFSFIFVIDC